MPPARAQKHKAQGAHVRIHTKLNSTLGEASRIVILYGTHCWLFPNHLLVYTTACGFVLYAGFTSHLPRIKRNKQTRYSKWAYWHICMMASRHWAQRKHKAYQISAHQLLPLTPLAAAMVQNRSQQNKGLRSGWDNSRMHTSTHDPTVQEGDNRPTAVQHACKY